MLLIKNIKELVNVDESGRLLVAGKDMSKLDTIKDAFLITKDDKIASYGLMTDLDKEDLTHIDHVIDARGSLVFPSFCDSHTHMVYAGSREIEYQDKIKGLSYEEIAKRGGGILNSAKRMQETSEDDLLRQTLPRIKSIMEMGTGAVEIKSGYGLSLEAELKMLRVIKRLKELVPVTIKATFLGAHAVPADYKGRQGEYVDMVINEMLPVVAEEKLADYIDVFCDKGFFTVEETDRILAAAQKYGLKPKIHANELDYSGGIQVGVKYGALSVDHLEYTGEAEIKVLKNSGTMPTLLPGAAFFLGMIWGPAREMIDAGLPLALASDYNPGSAPSGNMQLVAAFGSVKYRMLPEEVIYATTMNTAYAMELSKEMGSITVGKKANLWISKPMPTYQYLPYSFGDNKVDIAILNGEVVKQVI